MVYLTLDIGGSAIKYALVDDAMNFIKKETIPAPKEGIEHFLDAIYILYCEYKDKICGIGISMPGAINSKTGFARTGGAFPFIRNVNIVDMLHERIPIPITIENDARCAAQAEIQYGCLQGIDDAAVIVLGTGVGGCLVIDGKVHIGKTFASGEFSCVSMSKYCITSENEEWCQENGVNGLLKAIQKSMNTKQMYSGKEIFEMANNNNLDVLIGIDDFCDRLVRQVFNLQAIFDPQRIAIGGGISKQPILYEYINRHVDRMYHYYQTYDYPLSKPDVIICHYGNDANLIGAVIQLRKQIVQM